LWLAAGFPLLSLTQRFSKKLFALGIEPLFELFPLFQWESEWRKPGPPHKRYFHYVSSIGGNAQLHFVLIPFIFQLNNLSAFTSFPLFTEQHYSIPLII
jgi:hypothetical protein